MWMGKMSSGNKIQKSFHIYNGSDSVKCLCPLCLSASPRAQQPTGTFPQRRSRGQHRRSSWSRHFCSHRCWIQIQGISTGLHTLMDILWFLTSTERNVEGTVEQPLKEKSQKLIRMHWVATLCVWIHCSWHFCGPLPSTFNSRWYETCSDFDYLQR